MMRILVPFLILTSLGAIAVACSDDSTPSGGSTSGGVDASFDANQGSLDGAAGGDAADASQPADASPEDLEAPLLDSIKTVDAGITIGWTNNTPDCDSVVGERKDALSPYAQVFSVAGTMTSTTDTTVASLANASTTSFTYRTRCEKSGAFSVYSNELSAFGP